MSKNIDKRIDKRYSDFKNLMSFLTSRFLHVALNRLPCDGGSFACMIDGKRYGVSFFIKKIED